MASSSVPSDLAEPLHLLRLPAELRTQIFTFALLSSTCTCTAYPSYPSLLLANRQTNAEATSIFYRSLTFVAHPSLLTEFPSYKFPAQKEGDCPRCRGELLLGESGPYAPNSFLGGTVPDLSTSLGISPVSSWGSAASVSSGRSFSAYDQRHSPPLLHLRPSTWPHLRSWSLTVRLDAGPRFKAEAAARAFSGCWSLVIEATQSSFGVAGVDNLLRLKEVRGVEKVEVRGTRVDGFGEWLEDIMGSAMGSEGVEWEEQARKEAEKDKVEVAVDGAVGIRGAGLEGWRRDGRNEVWGVR